MLGSCLIHLLLEKLSKNEIYFFKLEVEIVEIADTCGHRLLFGIRRTLGIKAQYYWANSLQNALKEELFILHLLIID